MKLNKRSIVKIASFKAAPFTTDIKRYSDEEICSRIEILTTNMAKFWKSAHGWAPVEAAGLLSKSMLEWQASLASCLSHWLNSTSDGDLILAWANLGALVEGQLKLFLSVWYENYKKDAQAIKNRKGAIQGPDDSSFESLRQFFVKRIWTVDDNWDPYICHVQQRRNAIHAYKIRDIGSFNEWRKDLRRHLVFIRCINFRLPYPDDIYIPREI